MRILSHPSENVRTVAAYSIVGAYYYTIFTAVLGSASLTFYDHRQGKRNLMRPLSGAVDGVIMGWTHPVKFVEMVWNNIYGKIE